MGPGKLRLVKCPLRENFHWKLSLEVVSYVVHEAIVNTHTAEARVRKATAGAATTAASVLECPYWKCRGMGE